jgi:hypothetical protein
MGADGGTCWLYLKDSSAEAYKTLYSLIPHIFMHDDDYPVADTPNETISSQYGTQYYFDLGDLDTIVQDIRDLDEDERKLTWREYYFLNLETAPLGYHNRWVTTMPSGMFSYYYWFGGWEYTLDKVAWDLFHYLKLEDVAYLESYKWVDMKLEEWADILDSICYLDSFDKEETWT